LTVTSGEPAWVTPSAGGITQLTGDVTAGPGSGSVAATVAAIQGFATNANYDIPAFEYNAGNSGSSLTINFAQGSAQSITMTANSTFTFSNGVKGGSYLLRLISGGTFGVTWPTMYWPGGNPPTLSTTSGYVDLVNLYYDGTNWYGSYAVGYPV